MRATLDEIVSEEALKEMAEEAFANLLLMGPARPGDSWTKKRQLNRGPLGIHQSLQCTYEGRKNKLEKILVKITANNLSSRQQGGVGGVPFRIREANLTGKGSGFLYFDRAKGRLASSVMSMTLEGTIKIEIGGQKTQVDLVETDQTNIRTMDANPIGAASLRNENGPLRKENERLRKDNKQLRRRLQAVEEALHRQDKSK